MFSTMPALPRASERAGGDATGAMMGTRKDSTRVSEDTRVVLADDDVLLREGLSSLLARRGFDVVGQSGDATGLLERVRSEQPDLAIVDIRMPPTHTDEGIIATAASTYAIQLPTPNAPGIS